MRPWRRRIARMEHRVTARAKAGAHKTAGGKVTKMAPAMVPRTAVDVPKVRGMVKAVVPDVEKPEVSVMARVKDAEKP